MFSCHQSLIKMRKILAIDDQKDNLISIEAVLKSQIKNIEIIPALNGADGIRKAEKEQPDCIILDIIMPEMDGYQTCHQLKNNKLTSSIPIIMLTAIKTDNESRIKGIRLGADAFLPKPIDPIELTTQVSVMLRIKSAEDKLRKEKEELEKLVKVQTTSIEESNRKFKALYDNAPLPYQLLDKNGNITHVNNAWLKTLGFNENEAIGRSFYDFLAKDYVDKFRDTFRNLEDGGEIRGMECKLVGKKGNFIEVQLSANANYDPELKSMELFCVFRDITEYKKAKREIAESERQFNTLIRNLEGIAYRCLNNRHWTMKFITSGIESITGYKIEDIIDDKLISFSDIIHSEDRDQVFEQIQTSIKNKEPFEIQYRLITKDGVTKHVINKGLLITSQNNEEIIEGFIYDVSSTIEAEIEVTKLLSAVTQSPSVIAITDTKGVIEYINPKFTEITGYKLEEAIGQRSNILKSGLQDESMYMELWETIEKGEIWRGNFQNKRKNGSIFWESASIFPVLDPAGNIINYIKVAEDITEIIKSEKALLESEARYEKLLETTGEGFWVINKEGTTLEVNTALCNLLGFEKDEIIGKTPYDFVDEENEEIFRYQISRADSDVQRTYEVSLKNKYGNNIPTRFNATSIKNAEGEFLGSFALVSDISKSKRAELIQQILYKIATSVAETINLNELIEEIRKELGRIIDTTNFFVALYDKENDMLTLPFFADQKDKVVSIPSGKSLTDYIIKTQKPLLANRKIKDDLEKQGKIERFGSNSEVWLGVPLKFEGDVIGVLVVQSYEREDAYNIEDMRMLEFVSDQISITINRKRTEESVKLALEKATESDRLKTAFLQNISHEIRTPMNGILGFTGLMKEPGITGEEQQAYLDVIMISGNRMLNTLNDLMDMSMLETGQVKINVGNVNIQKEINTLFEMFRVEASKKGLELTKEFPEEESITAINTDREKVFAIMSNLLKNAIKYTREGNIAIGYMVESDDIVVYVKDTGIGIPNNRIDAIFERFVQADIEDVKVHEGSGLGLSISKAYIELLGGRIWVESTFGEGSEFYFSLPIEEPENKVVEEVTEEVFNDTKPNKGLKILIAEDEEFAR